LSELSDAFAQTKADVDLGPPFSLALHWYQNSNIRAGGMEGAIILNLTALDLLGAMVVVDRAVVTSDGNYDKLVESDVPRKARQPPKHPPFDGLAAGFVACASERASLKKPSPT
jgi:hypothetical protein